MSPSAVALLVLLALLAGALVFLVLWSEGRFRTPRSGAPRHAGFDRPMGSPTGGLDPRHVFRPTDRMRPTATIHFRDRTAPVPTAADREIEGVVDTVTGQPLNRNSRLFRCRECRVFYQEPSYAMLPNRECVQCGATEFEEFGTSGHIGDTSYRAHG